MKARILQYAGALLVLTALTATVFHFRGGRRPHPPLREAALRELSLRDGQSYLGSADTPFTGIVVEAYPDGSLKSRSQMVKGRLDGVSEGWFTNGVLQIREHFLGGFSHGVRTKWFASGNRHSEAPIAHGKIEGTFRRWHEDGALAEEIEMKDGSPDGVSRAYYPSGFLKVEVRLADGKVIARKDWKDGECPGIADAVSRISPSPGGDGRGRGS